MALIERGTQGGLPLRTALLWALLLFSPGLLFGEDQASVDLFGLTKDDFIEQVDSVITVGEFYEIAAGGQIIFT